jgi:hypothetical protein
VKTADYKVWVPVAGDYRLDYRVRGSGTIQAGVVGVAGTYPTAVTNPTAAGPGVTTPSPTIHLAAGLQTLRLTAPAGSWTLNWFRITASDAPPTRGRPARAGNRRGGVGSAPGEGPPGPQGRER